jgi:hypothetical protein
VAANLMFLTLNNGVKQGSVISPILFTVYMDELIEELCKSGFGCKIGNVYYGILIYADDIFLLAPTITALQHMLDICAHFSDEKGLMFNASKTQCIKFHRKHVHNDAPNLCLVLNDSILQWSYNVLHLGHKFDCCFNFSKDTVSRKGAFIQIRLRRFQRV